MIKLRLRYVTTFSYANFFARIFLNNAKISIVAINSLTFHLLLKAQGNLTPEGDNEISNPLLFHIIMAFVTWMAASIFLEVVDNVVMTLLVCLSLDLDKNDPNDKYGSGKFGPPTFHDKRNRYKEKVQQQVWKALSENFNEVNFKFN